ncbi:hypothetical protein IAD21_00828 [Abditibacteriota bacterium]|nr:hypothetical protein IAD21_00828 [Abditibacteriota bacterium]
MPEDVPLPVPHDFSPRLPHKDHLAFVDAIHARKCIRLTFCKEKDEDGQDREVEVKTCIPLDYGPMLYGNATPSRYQFAVKDIGVWGHRIERFSLFPGQIINMEKLDVDFEPAIFGPDQSHWCIYRHWGLYRPNT